MAPAWKRGKRSLNVSKSGRKRTSVKPAGFKLVFTVSVARTPPAVGRGCQDPATGKLHQVEDELTLSRCSAASDAFET